MTSIEEKEKLPPTERWADGFLAGWRWGLVDALVSQLVLRFDSVSLERRRDICAAPTATLNRWLERVMSEPTLDAVLQAPQPPPELPGGTADDPVVPLRGGPLPKPSEDASDILGPRPAAPISTEPGNEERDEGPIDEVHWIVEIGLPEGTTITAGRVLSVLSHQWCRWNGEARVYGRTRREREWKVVYEGPKGSEPIELSEVCVVWPYYPRSGPGPRIDKKRARAWLDAMGLAARSLGGTAVAHSDAKAAGRRAREIEALNRWWTVEASINLHAPDAGPFRGDVVWDVLSSLGLRGDGEAFHWDNEEGAPGAASLFVARTWSYLGPFSIPNEPVAELKLSNLRFEFTIPCTHDPEAVFDAALRAARYAQKRLGGEIVFDSGHHDEAGTRTRIRTAIETLTRAGFIPGSAAAMAAG